MGGVISTKDSEDGNALMLLIANPHKSDMEIAVCFGERRSGWLGRGRTRFRIPMNGIPHRFSEDSDRCFAWNSTSSLPSMEGLVQLYVRDTAGNDWPVENADIVAQIGDRLAARCG